MKICKLILILIVDHVGLENELSKALTKWETQQSHEMTRVMTSRQHSKSLSCHKRAWRPNEEFGMSNIHVNDLYVLEIYFYIGGLLLTYLKEKSKSVNGSN